MAPTKPVTSAAPLPNVICAPPILESVEESLSKNGDLCGGRDCRRLSIEIRGLFIYLFSSTSAPQRQASEPFRACGPRRFCTLASPERELWLASMRRFWDEVNQTSYVTRSFSNSGSGC